MTMPTHQLMRIATFIVFCATLVAFAPPEDAQFLSITSLWARVDSLQVFGRYQEAAGLAEQLLGVLRRFKDTQRYQIEDAERLIVTLRGIHQMPRAARSELSEAQRLHYDIEEALAADEIDTALKLVARQYDIHAHYLGESHPWTTQDLTNMGHFLYMLGEYDEAEAHYRDAIAYDNETLGREHPTVAEEIAGIASTRHAKGDLDAAEKLYREALEVYEKTLGQTSDEYAATLDALNEVVKEKGDATRTKG
jgi:tetratricopeptide (TPR) repeat protein